MPFRTLLRNGVGTGGVEIWAGFLRVKCVGAIRLIEQGLGGEMGRVEVARGGEGSRGTGWGEGGVQKPGLGRKNICRGQ